MAYRIDEGGPDLTVQAAEIEATLPRIMRRLFTVDLGHPATELPLTQLRVCAFLQAGPSPITAVADELGISVSAATQIADRLERTGLVERSSDPADRRVKNLSMTSRGLELMKTRKETRIERVKLALSQLPPESRAAIVDALGILLDTSLSLPVTTDGNLQI